MQVRWRLPARLPRGAAEVLYTRETPEVKDKSEQSWSGVLQFGSLGGWCTPRGLEDRVQHARADAEAGRSEQGAGSRALRAGRWEQGAQGRALGAGRSEQGARARPEQHSARVGEGCKRRELRERVDIAPQPRARRDVEFDVARVAVLLGRVGAEP